LFSSADVAARAAGALFRGARGRARARRALGVPQAPAEQVTASPGRPERALPEDEAARLLQRFGVSILPAELARSAEDAIAAAGRLGFPVVLKVHAASIVHKTDVGGVHLDLRSAEDVRRAYAAASLLASEVRLTPYRRGGVEVLIGVRRDPEYGPILLCGRGGVLAEIEEDVAIRTLPCPREEIDEMLDETRVGALLSGPRGAGAASRDALAAALAALSRLLLATPAVVDTEVNPLRCAPDGAVALDARVLVS
jgi:acetyltransferase